MSLAENLSEIKASVPADKVTLVVVSKTQPVEKIRELYDAGQRHFGENRVQELMEKKDLLPDDIRWHLIGHLQSNKVKYIAPFIHLIHSIDSLKLLQETDRQARKYGRVIHCLLQIHIAREETKFGMDEQEVMELLESEEYKKLDYIRVRGVMGMATNTENKVQVRREFQNLRMIFYKLKARFFAEDSHFNTLSMGMSSDYELAIEEGSTLVRIGSAVFGERK
jgi:pyridoxal phosphate enzyme (YggS family)